MAATVHLDVLQGDKPIGHVHLSPGQPLEVGREGAGCRIADPAMSRRHFVLTQQGEELRLEDLGSSGGTFVNGGSVDGVVVLAHGDRVEAGETTFIVTMEEASADHIEGTTWHVHEPPPGYFVIGHLGLQREGPGSFAETVVCKEDQLAESTTLDDYADQQCERLKAFASDMAVTRAGPAAELAPLPSTLLRLAFTYQGTRLNQWHIYVRREQRVGIAVWTFEHPQSGEREQVRQFLSHLVFE
ncbi:MAG TPA: FHA domain-containing protein [Burkholderiaceae bacterium]|nr:FHA domain-containing protein [Burkholderiaceae bacterium]